MSDYRAYDRDRDYSPPRRGGGGGGGGYSTTGRDYSPPSRDEPRRHKSSRTIPRGRDDPDYIEETTFIERGKGAPPRDLIPRRRSSSIEDIQRDFPPPSRSLRAYRDDYDPRRARSSIGGRSRYDEHSDEEDDYRSRRGGGRRRDPRDRDDGYYSEDYERHERRGDSRSPKRKASGVEGLLAGLGLGGVAGALTGKGKERSRSRSRSRHGGRSRRGSGSRSRSPKGKKERQWAQAAQAALVAGAVEAFRSRKEPGPWTGDKGKRIATAAIGAGGIDRLIDRDPGEKSKRHLAEAVIGGLAANRLANGPTERDRSVDSRGRSRSRPGLRERSRSVIDRFRSKSRGRSRSLSDEGSHSPPARSKSRTGGIQKALAGGAVAAAGKAIYDRVRSKSRAAKERRRSHSDSEDSYVASRNRRRDVGPSSQRDRSLGPNDGAVVGPRGRAAAAGGGAAAIEAGDSHGRTGEKGKDGSRSRSSSESSTDLENKRKKMRGKEFLTAGLASIATIHAAHGVYQSMNASENRHKLVEDGTMSPEEARKKRSKAWLQDAAAVGIAALGIKGAYSEWKEMNEQRHSVKELEERREMRHKRRDKRMREMRQGGGGGGGGDRDYDRRSHSVDDYDDRRYGGGGRGRYDDGPYASGGLPPPPIPASGDYR